MTSYEELMRDNQMKNIKLLEISYKDKEDHQSN